MQVTGRVYGWRSIQGNRFEEAAVFARPVIYFTRSTPSLSTVSPHVEEDVGGPQEPMEPNRRGAQGPTRGAKGAQEDPRVAQGALRRVCHDALEATQVIDCSFMNYVMRREKGCGRVCEREGGHQKFPTMEHQGIPQDTTFKR